MTSFVAIKSTLHPISFLITTPFDAKESATWFGVFHQVLHFPILAPSWCCLFRLPSFARGNLFWTPRPSAPNPLPITFRVTHPERSRAIIKTVREILKYLHLLNKTGLLYSYFHWHLGFTKAQFVMKNTLIWHYFFIFGVAERTKKHNLQKKTFTAHFNSLRDINQKIFPILTVTDMSANQWSQFIKKDSGFAFLAYWNDMLVRNIILIILTLDVIIMAVNLSKKKLSGMLWK